jgi:shikimate dehydrogenase
MAELFVSGLTQVVGVIGDPVSHSLSPVIHNAAFRALGLDWVCVAFPTERGTAADALHGMSALGIAGLSVTMPHKAAVIDALDGITATAELLGAVNCISRSESGLHGHSTDGEGFLAGIRADFDFDPSGKICAVLGAGGAARSVILALAQAGAAEVRVVNRTRESAEQAARLAGATGQVVEVEAIQDADLVVNATSVGMAGTGSGSTQDMPCDPALLGTDQILADLIYHPRQTELMRQAELRGCRVANGLSMLIHQAAVAFEIWTGQTAPIDAMTRATEAAVSG